MGQHEDIYAEVERRLETLKTNGDVVTVSRDLKHIADVDVHKMPAIYLTGGTWNNRKTPSGRYERDLLVSVYCYLRVSEDDSPLTAINAITHKVLDLFKPDTNSGIICDLGGRCLEFEPMRCAVLNEGRIDKNKAAFIIDFQASFRVSNC